MTASRVDLEIYQYVWVEIFNHIFNEVESRVSDHTLRASTMITGNVRDMVRDEIDPAEHSITMTMRRR